MSRAIAWMAVALTCAGGCAGAGGGAGAGAGGGASAGASGGASAGASGGASAGASGGAGARKRSRTGPAQPTVHDGTKPKNGRVLNPRDALGRTVFVAADDRCFVEVPPKVRPSPDTPVESIERETETVDCPPAVDDAAWDHCTAQIVLDEGGRCFCVSGAGKPRPMPRPTPCPSGAR